VADVSVLDEDDPGPRRAVERLLQLAHDRLGMEAAFLAELTETEQIYRATAGEADSFTIFQGGRLPRLEGYCRRVMEMDAPWIIRDTRAEPEVAHLAITSAGNFGAYIGVPVKQPDGSPFGTLCCLSHTPRPELGDVEVAGLQALADQLGFHVAQLAEHRDEIRGLEDFAAELAATLHVNELRLDIFQHLVDASPNPKLLLDPDSLGIVYANAAAATLAGVDRELMIERAPWQFHASWDEVELRRWLEPLRNGEAGKVQYEVDGSPALDAQAQRVSSDGGPTFILWTGHDVTHHRESEERLEHALALEREAAEELRRFDALRNTFLTAVSHELRTPLTTVRGMAETLDRGVATPDVASAILERLRVNAERLDRLLTDLLDLNQFSHGSLSVRREAVRVDELVRDAVADVDLGDHRVELRLAEVEARVAPVKVERLVANLVVNAAVHTPPGTPIEVELDETTEGVSIVVTDHGPGVPPEARDWLFEPFTRGTTAPPHRPGAGIGLSLVAAFTDLHGGRVWVEDAPGGGAAFHVVLPKDAPSR
jgi:PAS domain S-box-containing protein